MAPNTSLALEQVKIGLNMLYRAGYLTENALIKIDGLIHNGQYVFTRGPPNHILDEPLMLFEVSKQEAKDDVNVQDAAVYPFKTFENDAVVVLEKQMSSPVCYKPAASTQFPAKTPSEPFAETSSDEGNTLLKRTGPAEKLSPDCVHTQFDEAKRSNAGLTQAGRKSCPICASVDDSERETYSPEPDKASERKICRHSSVSVVDAEGFTSLDVASPQHSQSWNQPYPSLPESINDSDRAKYSGLLSKRPESRATNTAARTAKSPAASSYAHVANSVGNGASLQLEVEQDTILIAQSSFTKKAKVQIDVRSGDSIKVLKHISGVMYLGENLRTKQRGQFSTLIFQKSSQAQNKYSLNEKQRAITVPKTVAPVRNTDLRSSNTDNDLDKVEGINAAEWDEDSASVATAPIRSSTQELAGKDSGLPNLENQSQFSESKQEEIMRAMMSKMLDEELQKRKADRTATSSKRVPPGDSETRVPWKEPLKSITPKSQTCWFWATPGKECRFTDDECRDLHSFLPFKTGEPVNLRMGKPTWGALADSLSSSSTELVTDPKGKKGTCWYWANNAKCKFSAESCKFLHEQSPAGVTLGRWEELPNWREENEERGSQAEMKDGSDSGWGKGDAGCF